MPGCSNIHWITMPGAGAGCSPGGRVRRQTRALPDRVMTLILLVVLETTASDRHIGHMRALRVASNGLAVTA